MPSRPHRSTPRLTPEDVRARVLFRDAQIIVLDKPAGVPVHAGPGGGLNLEMFFDALRFGLSHPPALAHRLDRDTSGCLVLGRNRRVLAKLGRLFAAGAVEKVYWAVVLGAPPEAEGRIDLPLAKDTRVEGWRMVPAGSGGQAASTEYRVLGRGQGLAWLELRPRTGRTHQIRVHCAALGCPVLGDGQYGGEAAARHPLGRTLHLHARAITLPLYADRPSVSVTAPPPAHMQGGLAACGWTGEAKPA